MVIIPGYGVRIAKDAGDQPVTDRARNCEHSCAGDNLTRLEPRRTHGYPACLRIVAMLSACFLRLERMRHILRPDPFVELFRGQEAQLQSRFPKSELLAIGFE
jgi:hypothetical protein